MTLGNINAIVEGSGIAKAFDGTKEELKAKLANFEEDMLPLAGIYLL